MSDSTLVTPDASQQEITVAREAAEARAGEQGLLFGDSSNAYSQDLGYRGPVAASVVGITYRQLDYWARTELVRPSVRSSTGSGTARLYGFRDILELKIVKRLLDTGVSLQQIRTAVEHLRARGADDLTQVTLMSDGASVYECMSNDEVIDLVQGGQGVFGIAVGRVWQEIEGSLASIVGERATDDAEETSSHLLEGSDEFSSRRRARAAGA